MRGVCVLALVTILAFAASPAFAQTLSPDGLPRPDGYPVVPTRAYGSTPPCVDPATNEQVDCDWYGFSHITYPTEGAQCLLRTRLVLSNTSFVGLIAPYKYYYLTSQVFNQTTNDSYCVYGCFNMGVASPPGSLPPPPDSALPPVEAPPPPDSALPPVEAPPPPTLEPPPAPTPVFLEPPPVLPPTTVPAAPPPPVTTPGVPAAPVDAVPPPPRGVFNLNAAGHVRPVTGVLSLVVSGALLILHLLVC